MKHLKKFNESLVKNSNHRLSLSEEDFKNLCLNGYIYYNYTKIPIDKSNFTSLISGDIIKLYSHELPQIVGLISMKGSYIEICLKDIGYDRIQNYIRMSGFY